jgi:hypothetical protein
MRRKTISTPIEELSSQKNNTAIWAEIDIRSTLDKYIPQETFNNVRGYKRSIRCYEVLAQTLADDLNAQTYTVAQIAKTMQELGIWNTAVFTEMFLSDSTLAQFKMCRLNTSNQAKIISSIKQNLRGEQQDLAIDFYKILQQTNRKANYLSTEQRLRGERAALRNIFTKNKTSPLYLETLAEKNSAVQEKFIDYLLEALEIKDLCMPGSAENAPPIYNPQIFSKTTFTDNDLENLFGKDTYALLKDTKALPYLFTNNSATDQFTPNLFADTGSIFNANNYRYTYYRQWKLQELLENAKKTFKELLQQKQAEDNAEAILRELLGKAHELKQQELAAQNQSIGG